MPKKNLRLVDTTYENLCASIANGVIKPGDWIRQASLAEELDISQVTARDALNKLVTEGLAERIPRKGVKIPFIFPEDLQDIYELRMICEGIAWQVAAERITEKDLDQMRSILPYTGTNEDPKSVNTAREKNQEFHLIAINASGRRVLIRILSQLLNLNNLRYLLSSSPAEVRIRDGRVNIEEHTALLAALENHDGKLSRSLIENHIKRSMSDRLALYGNSAPNK